MSSLEAAVREFMAARRVAVAGVSRDRNQTANFIYRKLAHGGLEVFPVNPAATTVEGATCYPDLKSIPGGVDAVLLVTPPAATEVLVRECHELGIGKVWMHRAFGAGSRSEAAVRFCREHGISVIDGACPMMFYAPVDFPHRCMRAVLGVLGQLPNPEPRA